MSTMTVDMTGLAGGWRRQTLPTSRVTSTGAGHPRPLTAAPTAPSGLRLTRRGRVAIVLAALALAAGTGLMAQSAEAGAPGPAQPMTAHTVQQGETLWELAAGVTGPGQDVRDVIDEIMVVNGLDEPGLQTGQVLLIPVD